jgi:hypothetical protein
MALKKDKRDTALLFDETNGVIILTYDEVGVDGKEEYTLSSANNHRINQERFEEPEVAAYIKACKALAQREFEKINSIKMFNGTELTKQS